MMGENYGLRIADAIEGTLNPRKMKERGENLRKVNDRRCVGWRSYESDVRALGRDGKFRMSGWCGRLRDSSNLTRISGLRISCLTIWRER